MSSSSLAVGDLVNTQSAGIGIVINIWDFSDIGMLVAVMINGTVKVFPIHEITKEQDD